MLRIPIPWLAALVISAAAVTVYFYVNTLPYAIPAVFPSGEVVEMSSWDYVFAYASAYPVKIQSNATLDSVAWAKYGIVVAAPKVADGSWIWGNDGRRVTYLITNISGTIWTCYYHPEAAFGGAYLCSQNVVSKISTYFYLYVPIPQISTDTAAYNILVGRIRESARLSGVAFDKPVYALYGNVYMYNDTTIGISAYQDNGVLTTIPLKTTMQKSTASVEFYPEYYMGSLYSMPDETNAKIYWRAIYIVAFRPAAGTSARVTLSGGPGP